MDRPARLTLAFAALFAVFVIGPTFLSGPFGPYPLLKQGDLLDLLTPIVLIPVYWLLLEAGRRERPGRGATIAFLVLAVLWVEGQGIHLAGNAIWHLTRVDAGSPADTLAVLFDEVIGHYLWHAGMLGLSALVIARQWKAPQPAEAPDSSLGPAVAAGALHGFSIFLAIVEGATTRLGVPFTLAVVVFTVMRGLGKLRRRPILAFFFAAYLVATLFFLGWGLYWRGLPEFSKVGIID